MKVTINDILKFSDDEFENIRVKFNMSSPYEDPFEVYKNNLDVINNSWLFWHGHRRYYPRIGMIAVGLVRVGKDRWLLTTIKKITKILDVSEGIGYEGVELKEYTSFFGRLILSRRNTSEQIVFKYRSVAPKLEIVAMLPQKLADWDLQWYEWISSQIK